MGLRPDLPERVNIVKDFVRNTAADIYGAYKVNTLWDYTPEHLRPQEIFRTDRALRTQTAHNKHHRECADRKTQYGGTMLLAIGQITQRLTQKGQDQSGLGRWSWMLLHGKDDIKTRIISAYCPTRSNRGNTGAVYNQQRRWLRRQRRKEKCPRKAFIQDICHFINGCRTRNERIVMFIDANADIRDSPLTTSLAELDIREGVTSQHPDSTPPATYELGSLPINGIYLSPELQPTRAGYLPFCGIGDHRAAYVDIPWDTLVGDAMVQISRPQARRLTTKDPRIVNKYHRLLNQHMETHNIFYKLQTLETAAAHQDRLTPQQQDQLEQIDDVVSDGMRYAEKNCRKLAMGGLDFSPEMLQAWDTLRLWNMVKQRLENKRRSRTKIRRLAKKLKINQPMNKTMKEVDNLLTEAYTQTKSLRPTGGVLRDEFLRTRKNDPTLDEATRKRAHQALQTERARKAARQIQHIKGRVEGGAVSQVEVHPPAGQQGPPMHFEQEQAVIEAIMDMVQKRYRLTETTPLMQHTTQLELGLTGNTETAQQILDGNGETTTIEDPTTADLMRLFTYEGASDPIPTTISPTEFTRYWKRAKESTSSSLSGRHFGHYKAAANQPHLAYLHSTICNLAYTKGQPLPRWTSGLTVMLEKEPGAINVDKLRAILLLEADFNFANKLYFGSRMIRRAQQDNLIPEECFGGIRHRNPHQLGLVRKCLIDLATISLTTIAIASVDAAQCYDRIQHTAASLACQAWGVPLAIMHTILTTVQRMKIHLRTAFGDTQESIPNAPESPFQGILQGNGAGPAIWLAISAFLVKLLRVRGHGTHITTPITGTLRRITGLFFVDDTDIIVMAEPGETDQSVIQRLQETIDTWQGGLQASGGALKPAKCAWSIKAFRFNNGRPNIKPPNATPGHISIQVDGTRQNIQRISTKTGVKAVGFTQSLDGSMKEQLTFMKRKADTWAGHIKCSYIDRKLAWHAIRTTIWPSLKFPLPVCTMTWAQGDTVIRSLYKSLLPALGANRNYPKLWRHAPTDFMGLDLPHPYVEQGIAHISNLLTLGASDSLPGHSLRTQLETAQLAVGTDEDFLHMDIDRWGHTLHPSTLAHAMWNFCSNHNIFVEFDQALRPPNQREKDQPLMELIARLPHLNQHDLSSLNQCRLAKKVYFLSDMTEGNGKYILDAYLQPNTNNTAPRASTWRFPAAKPARSNWALWKATLQQIFPRRRIPRDMELGPWISEPHLHMPWYLDEGSDTLWKHTEEGWECYRLAANRSRRHQYAQANTTNTRPPATANRTTVTRIGHSRYTHSGCVPPRPQPTHLPASLQDTILSLDHYRWPLDHAWFPQQGTPIAQAIRQGTAIGVSDGSYNPHQDTDLAAAGWVVFDLHTSAQIGGVVEVNGTEQETNAYRAELQGLHTMLLGIYVICLHHNILEGSIILGLDNEYGVRNSNDPFLDPTDQHKHVDLVRAIRRLRALIPITIHLEHVAGHQDEKSNTQLTPLEELNVAADAMAKAHLHHLHIAYQQGRPKPDHNHIYCEGTRVFVDGTKLTTDGAPDIRHAVFAPKMRKYLAEKDLLPLTAFDLVDWQAIRQAANQTAPLFRLWASKNACGHCGVGKCLERWGHCDTARCRLCLAPEETARHVAICPSACAEQARIEGLAELEKTLTAHNTAPAILHCLINGIRHRHRSFADYAEASTMAAARDQDEIGWAATVEGRISKKWMLPQHCH